MRYHDKGFDFCLYTFLIRSCISIYNYELWIMNCELNGVIYDRRDFSWRRYHHPQTSSLRIQWVDSDPYRCRYQDPLQWLRPDCHARSGKLSPPPQISAVTWYKAAWILPINSPLWYNDCWYFVSFCIRLIILRERRWSRAEIVIARSGSFPFGLLHICPCWQGNCAGTLCR